MDIARFAERKNIELSYNLKYVSGHPKQTRHEKSKSSSTDPGNIFKESLKLSDCTKILSCCMQNIEKQIQNLYILAQGNNDK